MSSITHQQIADCLSYLGKDIEAPPDISIQEDGRVFVALVVDPAKGKILEDLRLQAEKSLKALPGVSSVTVVLTSERKAPPSVGKKNVGTGFSHKISERPVAPDVRHIIAVASGKGGVGKSTVSLHLALAFAALGKKTGLLDADIYGASQPRMTGLLSSGHAPQPQQDAQGQIMPLEIHGLKVMSMGFFVDSEKPVIWRGPMVHSAIQQLLRDVVWGDLDVLIIDLPPGTGDAQLSLAQYVPLSGAVIVSTPQEVALVQARKAVAMFEKTAVPVLGMIENMSHYDCPGCGHASHIFGKGGVPLYAQEKGLPFLGAIPLTEEMREKADQGLPQESGALETFKNIAARLWLSLPQGRERKTAS